MKRWGRKTGLVLLSVSLLLVFGLTGCPAPVDELELTPAELVRNVVEAYQGIETFQFEMSATTHIVTEIAGEQTEMTGTSTTIGVIDLLNERMRMAMTMQVPIPAEARMQEDPEYMEMVMVTYIIDGMLYMKTSMPEEPADWTKGEIPWGFQPVPVDQLVQLLKASEVELLGTEVVRGIDSFVVLLVPDMEKLLGIMAQQMGVDPQMVEIPEDVFRDVTITQWICKDTFLPVRERMQMTIVLGFEMMTQTMTTDATTYYHSFNEPVEIVLSPEAAYAVETPMP